MRAPSQSAADGVLGVSPRLTAEPSTLAEAQEALRSFAGDRLAVTFVGGGTDLDLGAPPERLDVLFRTRRLARIVEHAPSDQIVVVEGGLTIAELQRALAAHGQRLAIDPPLPERATAGGIVAANAFGPLRARYGAARDLVIGITIVRADGVVARGGGKVVKNVAGFDLPRLFCGSLGTLGLVAEVVFRLHPLPEATGTVSFDGLSAAEARALTKKALDARLEPVSIAALSEGGGPYRLALRFAGFAPGVREQSERLLTIAGRPGERLDDAAAAALWARHDELRTSGDVRLKATFAPARAPAADGALRRIGAAFDSPALVLYPSLGIAFAGGQLRDPHAAAHAVEAARAELADDRGAVVVAAAPASLRERVDVWGPPPPGIDVMRRLKQQLDPERRLSPGRFLGGI